MGGGFWRGVRGGNHTEGCGKNWRGKHRCGFFGFICVAVKVDGVFEKMLFLILDW